MVLLLLVAHAVEHVPNRKGNAESAPIVTNMIGSLVFAMQLVELRKYRFLVEGERGKVLRRYVCGLRIVFDQSIGVGQVAASPLDA